ncbi:MAG: type II toxin-antitoxin system VapC family toxin [Vicinamibacteria bacterium]
MPTTLVDANVLIDVINDEEEWADWSAAMLALCADQGPLVINPIIYAEVSYRHETQAELDEALPPTFVTREDLPWDSAFLAARACRQYRAAGGARQAPLPDFFIGAHAAVRGYQILTRDGRRYRTYFPTVRVIAP